MSVSLSFSFFFSFPFPFDFPCLCPFPMGSFQCYFLKGNHNVQKFHFVCGISKQSTFSSDVLDPAKKSPQNGSVLFEGYRALVAACLSQLRCAAVCPPPHPRARRRAGPCPTSANDMCLVCRGIVLEMKNVECPGLCAADPDDMHFICVAPEASACRRT